MEESKRQELRAQAGDVALPLDLHGPRRTYESPATISASASEQVESSPLSLLIVYEANNQRLANISEINQSQIFVYHPPPKVLPTNKCPSLCREIRDEARN